MIRGTAIEILVKKQTGSDPFNRPVYNEVSEIVNDVLITPLSDNEITDALNLTGKRAIYQLSIPKTDKHNWDNCKVRFFGEEWRVIGKPVKGIDSLIPLKWNLKVKVESVNGNYT